MTDRVLVAGAGPVGLTMALELARYGVAVRVIDKIAGPSDTSRAVAIWPLAAGVLSLVRPDGYLASSVAEQEWKEIADYLAPFAEPTGAGAP